MVIPSLTRLKGLVFFMVLAQIFAASVFSAVPADLDPSAQVYVPTISPDSDTGDFQEQSFSEFEEDPDSTDFLMSEEALSSEDADEEEIEGEEVLQSERAVTQSDTFQILRLSEKKDKLGRIVYFKDEIRNAGGQFLYTVERKSIRYDDQNQIISYSETFRFQDLSKLTGKFKSGTYDLTGTLKTLAQGGGKQSVRLRYELAAGRLLIHPEAEGTVFEDDRMIVSLGKFSRLGDMALIRYYENINSQGRTTLVEDRFFDAETGAYLYSRKRSIKPTGYSDKISYAQSGAKLSVSYRDGAGFSVTGRLEDSTKVSFKYYADIPRREFFYDLPKRQFFLLEEASHGALVWDAAGQLIQQGEGITLLTELPALTNQNTLEIHYTLEGIEYVRVFSNLSEGENRLILSVYNTEEKLNVFHFQLTVDTIPPVLVFYDVPETDALDVGLYVFRYKVIGGTGPAEEAYRVVLLNGGDNDIVFSSADEAGNITERHFQIEYLAPDNALSAEEKVLRQRYLENEMQYFLNPLGVDPVSGFPIDIIGTNAPSGFYWTQPTSIGQYLNILGNILLSRFDTSAVSFESALARLENTVSHLMQVQTSFGWKGLIPWLRLEGSIRPDRTTYNFVDNVNLTHQIAALMGQLEKGNLHRSFAKDIYAKLEQFLANQKEGYEALVDTHTGLFYGYYDIASKKYATYHNGSFGNEVRASIPFLIAYYNLPASVWNNLNRENAWYQTQSGQWLQTFKTFDGGAFQYFWPLLTAPEETLSGMGTELQNALAIFIDHMNEHHLAGFVSASSLPWGGYSGKIGISELKQTSDAIAENIASVYAMGAAYRLNPGLIIQKLAAIESAFPQLMSPAAGFYDAMASWGAVSYNFYAIDKGSFLLGLMGKGGDDFQSFMQSHGLWQKYLDTANASAGPLDAASHDTVFDIQKYLNQHSFAPLETRKKKKPAPKPAPKLFR